ncbi:hypothetical protein DPMN_097904 [Dreissena polymorpha]|uniref:Uncharacterized protein n=1 Tax=Dreissena polymorpha TaxID=45954 RepID=A0A9D4LB31_DREPO|nr:hypothetical protein DPMN_097904 [Dreissena polymorpha]
MQHNQCVQQISGLNFDFKGQHITDIRNSVQLWNHVWYVTAQCWLAKGYWNKQRDSTLHSHFNLSAMMEQYIRFPESRHELKIIAYGFHE